MKIAFLGGGNMASALAGGMLGKGFEATELAIAEVLAAQRERLARDLGVVVHADVAAAAAGADVVVLAVKPQQMREVVTSAAAVAKNALVISIAAGIRLADIARWLGRADAKLVRCMPNTPALIGMGITGVYAAPPVSAAERALAERILGAVGKVVWVEREALLDPVTAISGSGPAYVFYFIEAMQQAAVAMGLSADVGRQLAAETFLGAAELALRSAESPEELRAKVTSKGGTTAAAIAAMDQAAVKTAIVRALEAANRRAAELADEFGRG